jgi:hypothetical protein
MIYFILCLFFEIAAASAPNNFITLIKSFALSPQEWKKIRRELAIYTIRRTKSSEK